MITMDTIGKVKPMHFRDPLSLSDIARRTGLSCNTLEKWVKAPTKATPGIDEKRWRTSSALSTRRFASTCVVSRTSGERRRHCRQRSRGRVTRAAAAA